MIVISGEFTIDPEDRAAALAAMSAMAEASNREEGCNAYGFWADPADDGRFRVFEEWASQEALDEHFATPHMAEFGAAITEVRVLGMAIDRYEVGSKAPLEL